MAGQALSIPRSLGALFDLGVMGDLPDGRLLDRLTTGHRESAELAFASLVERHGAMVLRVCRRQLDDPNDADDAFQSTFLVLLRRARTIRDRGSVASWLHGVALRVASRARVESARRRRIERRGVRPVIGRNEDPDRLDLESLIDEELGRLPERYRAPVVLCYLEGLTHEVAAARLGWPVGTVRGRLSRARDLLRSRLTRRGITATVALAAIDGWCAPAKAALPVALRESTLRSAVHVASGSMIAAVTSARVAAWVATASAGLALRRAISVAVALLWIGTGLGLGVVAASLVSQGSSQADPAAPADAREAIRREMLQLKGTWSTSETVIESLNGVPQPPKKVKVIWSIDRDTIAQSNREGYAGWTLRYTLDPGKSPKWIDLTSLNTGLLLHGIYKLDGETLTIGYDHERPGRFGAGPSGTQLVFTRESRTPTRLLPEYPNAEGCYWADDPGGIPKSSASGSINYIVNKEPGGAMMVVLASVARFADGEPQAEYRPVAFDRERRRYPLKPGPGGWSTSAAFRGIVLAQSEYRLDPEVLSFDRVQALGIEVVPAEVLHAEAIRASEHALREARAAGIETLPRPEVGRPFAFSLTDSKGRVLRSDEMKGKVVLIDCWASWSGPCTEKLPRLKAFYERRRGEGFEVIGLNFNPDGARGQAEQMIKAMALPWPQVFVPGDDRTRRLWKEGPGLPTYPRSLLIDRQGILRWEGGPDDLEARIDALLR